MLSNDRSILLISTLSTPIDIEEIGADVGKPYEDQRHHTHYMMHPQLRTLAQRVRETFPSCKFADGGGYGMKGTRLHVYHDTSPACMGWIGYGDFTTSESTKPDKFAVVSRLVSNGSYDYSSWQYNLASTISLDRAAKNARRYLRPYSPEDLANSYSRNCAAAYEKEISESRGSVNGRYAAITNLTSTTGTVGGLIRNGEALMHELVQLYKGGHIFHHASLHTAVSELVTEVDIKKDMDNTRETRMSMVCVSPDTSGKQVYTVCNVANIGDAYSHRDTGKFIFSASYTDEDLPAELVGGLSTLSILEDGQYVRGVGYRHNDSIFYVARD
jgi:hypothetical protein